MSAGREGCGARRRRCWPGAGGEAAAPAGREAAGAGRPGDAEEGAGSLDWGKRERSREPRLGRPGRKARVLALERARTEAEEGPGATAASAQEGPGSPRRV